MFGAMTRVTGRNMSMNNNLPGKCRCDHSRMDHIQSPGQAACKWVGCECTNFRGPNSPTYAYMGRTWPLVYTVYGRVSHILPAFSSADSSDPSYCGIDPFPYCWRGNSNHKENRRVENMLVCLRCEKHVKEWYTEREKARLRGE
jgi:hypothetical protein